MGKRLIFGIFVLGLRKVQSLVGPVNFSGVDLSLSDAQADTSSVLFYVAMLSMSLIAGLAYFGFIMYSCWDKNQSLLAYITLLVIALVSRTMFSLLIAGIVVLGGSSDVDGANALAAFECLSLNLVLAFWLTMTVYLHAIVKKNCNSEPNLKLCNYGVVGISVFFAFIWTFIMAGESKLPKWISQVFEVPAYQWIVSTLRLLYLCLQLGLIANIIRLIYIKKDSLDSQCILLIRKCGIVMGLLILLFWLQFGLSIGRPPLTDPEPYKYFEYLFDGLQCAAVCPLLYLLEKWGQNFINKSSGTSVADAQWNEKIKRNKNEERLVTYRSTRKIFTVDSMYSASDTDARKGETQDVVYSCVLHPDRLQKTINLYKRLNTFPRHEIALLEAVRDTSSTLKK